MLRGVAGSSVRYNPSAVAITGGTIDGAVIGGTTPAAITGTTITATVEFIGPIIRGTSNILATRNGTTAQEQQWYGTYSSGGTNYERLVVRMAAGTTIINQEQGGTGTARALAIGTGGAANFNLQTNATNRWTVGGSTGHFLGSTDNTFDIGSTGANRPRTGYFGTSVISPLYVAGASNGVTAGPFTTITSITVTGGIVTALTGS